MVIEVIRLGRVRYADAMGRMEQRVRDRMANQVPDALFLLEHEPVVTLGRRKTYENLRVSRQELEARGVELFETGRGGDVTYHGPGQIVGYPVLDLKPDRKDVRRYVRDLEEVMIRTCGDYDLEAGRVDGLIGAWIEERRKIGAIGVRISRWVTSHGFAFNVSSSLDAFGLIVPCGIRDKGVTSLTKECGQDIPMEDALDRIEGHFLQTFAERSAP